MNRRLFLGSSGAALVAGTSPGGKREPKRNGWIPVRLKGSPREIGFQHGSLLAAEIEDAHRAVKLAMTHDFKREYAFFRTACKDVLWPNVPKEYREEIEGIAEGLESRKVKLDLVDVVFLNAWNELPYYVTWYDRKHKGSDAAKSPTPEHCSAFVATGSYTRDGRPVLGHNAWTGYMEGQRWNIIFDVQPATGHAFTMDGYPGLIHSGDDFVINSGGLIISETTITGFVGFDPGGVAEFARARRAAQYASSIDEFARIMKEGNNGGYANNWLLADIKTNEIADLELGLKNVNLERTKDGYFAGSNFPINEKLIREEIEDFDVNDKGLSANARRARWQQVLGGNRGKIDIAKGKEFLADHIDAIEGAEAPSERTLCGHIDRSPRGVKNWQPPYAAAGAVQNKITDAAMAEKMTMEAAMGHACRLPFFASAHIEAHPEFAYQKGILRDLPSSPWTTFSAAKR